MSVNLKYEELKKIRDIERQSVVSTPRDSVISPESSQANILKRGFIQESTKSKINYAQGTHTSAFDDPIGIGINTRHSSIPGEGIGRVKSSLKVNSSLIANFSSIPRNENYNKVRPITNKVVEESECSIGSLEAMERGIVIDETGQCLIDLDGNFKTLWDLLNSLLIIYVITIMPFKIGFIENDYLINDIIDRIVDFLFLIDLILTFFTPYYDEGMLVISKKKIACHYISSWFWLDLISIMPISIFIPEDNDLTILSKINKIARLYRILKVVRLMKLLTRRKKSRESGLISKIIAIIDINSVLLNRLLPTFLVIFLVAHFSACIWHYISFFGGDETNNWIDSNGYRESPTHIRYIASLYFVFQTITTVGYGDIGTRSKMEFIVTILLMFIGVVLYSVVLTKVLDFMGLVLEIEEVVQRKVEILKQIAKEVKIPGEIYHEVMRGCSELKEEMLKEKPEEFEIPSFSGVNPDDVFDLHTETFNHKLSGIGLFQQFNNEDIMVEFGLNLTSQKVKTGDVIYEKGDDVDFFYIVKGGGGSFEYIIPIDALRYKSVGFYKVYDGFVGEFEIFKRDAVPLTSLARSNSALFNSELYGHNASAKLSVRPSKMQIIRRKFTCIALEDMKLFKITTEKFFEIFYSQTLWSPRKRQEFHEYMSFRVETIQSSLDETFKVYYKCLEEIKEEKERNPLLRLQRILKSNEFRQRYLKSIVNQSVISSHSKKPIKDRYLRSKVTSSLAYDRIDDQDKRKLLKSNPSQGTVILRNLEINDNVYLKEVIEKAV